MLDRNRDADLLTADVQSQPSSNALVREAQLLWKGVSSAPDYVLSSFDKENRAHTIQTALMSAGVTLALTCLKRSPSLSWTVGRIAAPALAVPALNDISARVSNMSGAMSDTWNSDRNWKQNVEISKETLGRFTADFAISAVASGFAEAAGRSYFGLKTPPGTNKLPELNRESILSNWQRHMDGEVVPYKMYSPEGGGIRQVDLFVPKNAKLAGEGVSAKGAGSGLLIAQDGLKLDFGKLKNLELPDAGLINLRADKSLDFVAAYTHPQRFRVIPGVNLSAWRHESGLIKEGGWFAPKAGNIDTAYLLDLEKSLTSLFKTDRTVLAGYSSGAIISNEVAAKLGPSRIQGVVSVASTVTGMEPAAVAGQFRLFVRDHGDPTLLQQGGAGGKAKHLASLGHKAVLQSKPENQVAYALSPYQGQPMISRSFDYAPTGTSIQHIALADGTPLVAQIKTTNNKHAWAVKDPDAVAARSASPVPSHIEDHLDLNALVKDIVNGNLQKFRVPS